MQRCADYSTFLPSRAGVYVPSPWIGLCDSSANRISKKRYCVSFWAQALRNWPLLLCVSWNLATMLWGRPSSPLGSLQGEPRHGHQQPAHTCQACEEALLNVDPPAPRRAIYLRPRGAEMSCPYPDCRFVSKINDSCSFQPLCFRVFYYAVIGPRTNGKASP